MNSLSLYDAVGHEKIVFVIKAFYEKAFRDPLIGHFFFCLQKEALVESQIAFTSRHLGGPEVYRGRGLKEVHSRLKIRKAHFDRRLILMAESMEAAGLEEGLSTAWLSLEARMRSQIVEEGKSLCQS